MPYSTPLSCHKAQSKFREPIKDLPWKGPRVQIVTWCMLSVMHYLLLPLKEKKKNFYVGLQLSGLEAKKQINCCNPIYASRGEIQFHLMEP